MFDFKKLSVKSGAKLDKIDFDNVIDAKFIKELRNTLNMTQRTFAASIGVSVKSIEKWETSDANINNATKRLLYLLSKRPNLIKVIYPLKNYDGKSEEGYEYEFNANHNDKVVHIRQCKDNSKCKKMKYASGMEYHSSSMSFIASN